MSAFGLPVRKDGRLYSGRPAHVMVMAALRDNDDYLALEGK